MRYANAVAVGVAGLLASHPALALDEEAVMKQLQAMQAQIQSLQGQVSSLKKELAQTKTQAASAQKMAEGKAKKEPSGGDVKISMVPAPKFETADGEYSFKVGGFAQLDAGMFADDKRDHPDGTTVRRARLNASGTIARDFNYKIENDFANNVSALTDVYLEYTGFKPVSIMVGQFKEPFSLETLTSDLFTSFVERASLSVFSPDRRIGVAVSSYGDTGIGAWSASGGFFGAGSGTASNDDESRDFTGRLTFAPIAEKTRVLHLGVAGSYRIPDQAGDAMRFQIRPETQLVSSTAVGGRALAVDTGSIGSIDDVRQLGLELAGVWGPASIQGEYVMADVNRYAGAEPTYSGYYVEASYFLTGESRNYSAKSGKFDRVTPMWPVSISQGQWGAWQVMARYSDLDLNDAGINGGRMKNTSAGVKWYLNANAAILLDYIKINTDNFAVTADDDPSVWMLRTQFDF